MPSYVLTTYGIKYGGVVSIYFLSLLLKSESDSEYLSVCLPISNIGHVQAISSVAPSI